MNASHLSSKTGYSFFAMTAMGSNWQRWVRNESVEALRQAQDDRACERYCVIVFAFDLLVLSFCFNGTRECFAFRCCLCEGLQRIYFYCNQ